LKPAEALDFVRSETIIATPPLVPEIRLHLASEVVPLWQATEANLTERGLPPPYWAFAWPGGQALARYILDNPEIVRGKRVLDVGCGYGGMMISMAEQGAKITGVEIDPERARMGKLRLEELGIPDRDPDLGCEQLQQVLVGRLPGPCRGQVADDQAQALVAGPQLGPDRAWIAGHGILLGDRGRVDEQDHRVDHPEGDPGILRGPPDQELDAIARRRVLDRGKDLHQLAVASLECPGQPVVALGQARQFVIPADADRCRKVAGRDPIDGGRDRPQGRGQVGREQVGHKDRDQGHECHEQEQQARYGRDRVGQALSGDEEQPEDGQWDDRGCDQGEGEAGPEANPRAERRRRDRPVMNGRPGTGWFRGS